MNGASPISCAPFLTDGIEPEQVREQLDRMLQSSLFRQSRRYAPLLRFVVEESLEGRGDLLKERLLGIHVLQREPSYDTAADPIVRVTIAEIRKRIAQYYHDEAHETELRIELPPGRYVAEFRPARVSHLTVPLDALRLTRPVDLVTTPETAEVTGAAGVSPAARPAGQPESAASLFARSAGPCVFGF